MANETIDLFAKAINNNFPKFNVQTVEWLGEGFRSTALLVNNEWVFRFPKGLQGAVDLSKEMKLLPLLSQQTSVFIPEFTFIGKQENGLPFVGYSKLPGEIVGEASVPCLADEAQSKLAAQIAVFMDEVNKFPVEMARNAGVPARRLKDEYLVLFNQFEEHVVPLINESFKKYIVNRFNAYVTNTKYTDYEQKLIHGDFSPDHFLTDPETGNLTSIIDFGDAVICDPDYDYVYLLEDCGKQFTQMVMQHRGVADPETRLRKISFFVTFDQLRYVLEGIRTGKEEWIQEGIELIEHEMLLQGND